MMKKVTFIDRYIPQYRKDFYLLLRSELAKEGINLQLIYGVPNEIERSKGDFVDIDFGIKIKNLLLGIGQKKLIWQPALRYLKDSDLIIVDQANRLLINYILQFENFLHIKKVCFWGHGKNFQSEKSDILSELLKRQLVKHVHWWFVYNSLSLQIVEAAGFPKERITNVQNSIDTVSLAQEVKNYSSGDLEEIKNINGIKGSDIALFVGSMYAEKRLDFLIDSCYLVKKELPDFELLLMGGGPTANIAIKAAKENPWIHYFPPKFENDKIPYFLLSKAVLMPFAVGLVMLDSFALGTPLLTTHNKKNGPEIDYLIDGYNGLFAKGESISEYSNLIELFFTDKDLQRKIQFGCQQSAKYYSIQEMVGRFVSGIKETLEK